MLRHALAFLCGGAYGAPMVGMTRTIPLAMLAAATLCSSTAVATEKPAELPGVEGKHSIVQPAPEPENVESESPYGPGFVKVGNSWVKISGRIRYDVDVSTRDAERKKPGK